MIFREQHFLHSRKITRRERIEINTTRNTFTLRISASERDIDMLSPQMLKTTSDEALFLELAMRGYDLSLLCNTHGLPSEVP